MPSSGYIQMRRCINAACRIFTATAGLFLLCIHAYRGGGTSNTSQLDCRGGCRSVADSCSCLSVSNQRPFPSRRTFCQQSDKLTETLRSLARPTFGIIDRASRQRGHRRPLTAGSTPVDRWPGFLRHTLEFRPLYLLTAAPSATRIFCDPPPTHASARASFPRISI